MMATKRIPGTPPAARITESPSTAARESAGRRGRKAVPKGEEGYVLLIAIFLMALLVLSLAVAAPKIAKSIQRDQDLETYHRGMEYRRAIQLYYRKFHAYPPNVDALVNTNQIRFLRKKYTDPITRQDDWKPILFGQNKTPTAMGFFGQALSGGASTLAGIGPSGSAGIPGITMPGSGLGGPTGSSTNGFGGDIFSSTDNTNGQSSASGAAGSTGTDNSNGSSAGSTSATSGTGSSTGLSGQSFGGAGIIGFEPGADRASILIYKKKQRYNQWEFTYDPLSDVKTIGGGSTGLNGTETNPTNPTNSPFGPSTNPTSAMPPETPAPQ